jgi:endonuclease/exonuclease/phosphatase family metal-dependent hydrolase
MKFTRWFPLLAAIVFAGSLASCRSTNTREGILFPAGTGDRDVDTFRVLTWNLRHFVDPFDSPYIQNEWDDRLEGMSDERIDLFVQAIRRINADVAVLEELESAAYLEDLAKKRFPEMGYIDFVDGGDRTWHQNVAVMSRFPLGAVTLFGTARTGIEGQVDEAGGPAAQNFTNHRLMVVEVFVDPDYEFLLAGLHLKAGMGERNAGWRMGQIRLLRARLNRVVRERPLANVLIAGDLNSTPETPEIAFLLHSDGIQFVDPLEGSDVKTMSSRNPRRRIDYLLPNTRMAPELVQGSMTVPMPLEPEQMVEVSDHLPVVAEFLARNR